MLSLTADMVESTAPSMTVTPFCTTSSSFTKIPWLREVSGSLQVAK
jgi:hypothetical protein